MNERRGAPIGLGGATILVTFTVLCLTALALMALSAARSDLALSEKTAKAISDYYAAETEAAERLASLDLAAGSTASFSVEIDENRILSVSAAMTDGGYDILTWRVTVVSDWSPDDALDVVR